MGNQAGNYLTLIIVSALYSQMNSHHIHSQTENVRQTHGHTRED